jgi:hypothetical protein
VSHILLARWSTVSLVVLYDGRTPFCYASSLQKSSKSTDITALALFSPLLLRDACLLLCCACSLSLSSLINATSERARSYTVSFSLHVALGRCPCSDRWPRVPTGTLRSASLRLFQMRYRRARNIIAIFASHVIVIFSNCDCDCGEDRVQCEE